MKTRLFLALSITLLFSLTMVAVVRGSPGISVSIIDVDPNITSPSDTATYTVSIESITTEDENIRLAASGAPSLGFNWTIKEFVLPLGATESLGLLVTYSGAGSGDFAFTISGEAWPTYLTYDEAVTLGLIETSNYATYVHVSQPPPVGGISRTTNKTTLPLAYTGLISAIASATALSRVIKRKQEK